MNLDSLPAKMAIGAIGGCGAAVLCHPLDVIRVTMQVAVVPRSTVATGVAVLREGGLRRGLYSGLSAAFLRQWTYGAGRMGIYSYLLHRDTQKSAAGSGGAATPPGFWKKIAFGMVSGGVGSFMGTPAELALVRMGADAKLPLHERRGQGVHRVLAGVIREDRTARRRGGQTQSVCICGTHDLDVS